MVRWRVHEIGYLAEHNHFLMPIIGVGIYNTTPTYRTLSHAMYIKLAAYSYIVRVVHKYAPNFVSLNRSQKPIYCRHFDSITDRCWPMLYIYKYKYLNCNSSRLVLEDPVKLFRFRAVLLILHKSYGNIY